MTRKKTISLEDHNRLAKEVSAAVYRVEAVSGLLCGSVTKCSSVLPMAKRADQIVCDLWHALEGIYFDTYPEEQGSISPYRRAYDELREIKRFKFLE